jgi:hypothetical protein
MTSAFDEAGARDALDEITRMMVGTKKMQDEPGVVYSLMAQKARPQDAQAIDQFMQSLEAEKQVQLARATGEVLNLDGNQQKLLNANGVSYTDVQYSTSTNAATQAASHIFNATKGAYTAKVKADGTLDLAPDGSIQRVKVEETHGESHDDGGGIWGAIGSVVGGVKDAAAAGLHGLNEGYNFVATGIDKGAHGFADNILGMGGGSDPQKASAAADAAQSRNTDDLDMRAQGYDPDSIWSTMAFQASGKAHTSLSSLVDSYGQDKVDQALRFLQSPKDYRDSCPQRPDQLHQGQRPDGADAGGSRQGQVHQLEGVRESRSACKRAHGDGRQRPGQRGWARPGRARHRLPGSRRHNQHRGVVPDRPDPAHAADRQGCEAGDGRHRHPG